MLAPFAPQNSTNYMENGRIYQGFKKDKYMFPCDEVAILTHDVVAWGGGLTVGILGGERSHGYLPQALPGRTKGPAALATLRTLQ